MNVPNRLTFARIFMAPIYLVLLMWEFPFHNILACAVFIIASLTDMLDGKLARKHNLITNLGKFLDPLADKMLTTAAFIGFLANGQLDVWAVMIILSREFLVTSVRLVSAGSGVVIAANIWGKLKTVTQMVSIIAMMTALEFASWQNTLLAGFNLPDALFTVPITVCQVLIWISVALTAVSGGIYLWDYRRFLTENA
ncbi:MAG: CDP-diacylglycerol--glycerol-3-phosphate 3-phosphatidyltransferase [Clostridia bacterium]|nr:CDP-diacylglycerol--glycerol-3-phosphate 3-phosphatidyltransferase [Clostridia bacterium]